MPSQQNKSYPDYDKPPVVETVLGVQFEHLPKMANAHLGAFWMSLPHSEWTTVQDAPPLDPQFENFKDVPDWSAIKFRLSRDISCRVQIRSAEQDRMIQVQNGRFHLNWLGHEGSEYPRYRQIRSSFQSAFDDFSRFAADSGLGEIRPNQWEVTYVNRIPRGTVWNTPDDWSFFRPLQNLDRLVSIKQESFGGEWHFEISEQRGRLHVQFQHIRNAEAIGDEAIVLNLTARGPLAETERELSYQQGLDLGHEVIVTNFRHLMSDEANTYWGLRNGNR